MEIENIEDIKKEKGLTTVEVIERYILGENLEKIDKETDLPTTLPVSYYHIGILPREKPLKITIDEL